ncbi:hypothetical protein PHLGIDRAFT_108068 [Phlebiopsis gigantea 11061_1 CR5-6]|uniref:Uncharacterized protein n=1 Tax=Phlebiopsis gigantea (strain 11061_1 CR5-6) TaxID=745531 RepID=A0A0C3S5H0_PHLG1|nr:hypothetical protein PHLGIDRAFT_108068 [Phlebiopsis gigantea 11061_1 CR5-6]
MSLQGLVSGSECAVPFNPLSQVLKHTEGDRSVQQDRIAGPSSSRLHHLPNTAGPAAADHDRALARQFFEANTSHALPNDAIAHVPPPQMHMQSLHNAPADLGRAWADVQEHNAAMQPSAATQFSAVSFNAAHAPAEWTAEFASSPQMHGPPSVTQQPQAFRQQSFMSPPMYGSMNQGFMFPTAFNAGPALVSSDKGKGKARDIDFDAAFAELDQALGPSAQETARIEEFDDVADLNEAMERMAMRQQAEATPTGGFEEVWDQLQHSDLPPPEEDLAKWEAQYKDLMDSQRGDLDFDYGASMEESWRDGTLDDMLKFDDEGLPILEPYIFEPENKYMDPSASSTSYLSDAKALLERGGSLTEVGLMLEAAIQKGDLGHGGYEAWILLGEVRSMDEREDPSMRALNEGVKRAVEAGASGEGMISLAISFTNESYERASHTMLLRWLHARFPDYAIPQAAWESLAGSSWNSHERVTETFMALAREQHARGDLDPDVQIGLGVLFYANGSYDRAKDCFEAALSVRPNDYLLWNRLGSSLSNGNQPEEALGAYRQALQLRPTYTRAIYNVGVACLNLGAHKEAAEHFLSTLVMQDSTGKGSKSDAVWLTLRKTFTAMGRSDLAQEAKPGADVEVFRKEGFDF